MNDPSGDPHIALAAELNRQDRLRVAEERLRLARQVLMSYGFYSDGQVGNDIAPRIAEYVIHLQKKNRELKKQNKELKKMALRMAVYGD